MTQKRPLLIYLLLFILLVLVAAAITFYRGDLTPFDPKLTMGLTALTLVSVMRTFGLIVGLNLIAGFLLKRPLAVLAWIIPGTGLVLGAHALFGAGFGLVELARIGWVDAYLMYLPAVGLMSLLGAVLGQILKRR